MKINLNYLLVIFALIIIGCSSENENIDNPQSINTEETLTINKTNIEFLNVIKNSSKTEILIIENNTDETINIDKVFFNSDNDTFKINQSNITLETNESFALEIEFTPKSKTDYFQILTIEYNDKSMNIEVFGEGINKVLDENDPVFGNLIKQNNGELNLFTEDLETIRNENYDEINVVTLGLIGLDSYDDFKNIEFNINLLEILNSASIDLSGLDNIKSLDQLTINSSKTIKNLKGLENISGNVGLSIRNNSVLENLDALKNITSSTINFVTINFNDQLSDFCGLDGLIKNDSNISSKLEIKGNKYDPTITDFLEGKCKK